MLTLNILPDNLKKEIEFRIIYGLIKTFLGSVIIAVSIYGICVLIALFLIEQHFIDTTLNTNLITKSSENYTNKVKSANNQLNSISNVQNEFVKWSLLLKNLSADINDNISLSRLTLDQEKSALYLSGVARTRDDLLGLKDTLEKRGYFSDISFPIKNLLEKNNIMFEISVKITSYEF